MRLESGPTFGVSPSGGTRRAAEIDLRGASALGALEFLRPKMRGRRKIEFATYLTFTGYKLVRMRNLLAPGFT